MLKVLVQRRGRPVSRDELAAAVEMTASGGTFSAYLSDLRTAHLIVDVDRGTVAANKERRCFYEHSDGTSTHLRAVRKSNPA